MDYQKHYDLLVQKAITENGRPEKRHNYTDGFEIHHITPKSCGGDDSSDNLVFFTHKQHFLAHHMLARLKGGVMSQAWFLMCHEKTRSGIGLKITSRQYETARKLASDRTGERNKNMSQETRDKISSTLKKLFDNEEQRERLASYRRGKKHSDEHKERLRIASTGKRHTEESKLKISIGAKNREPWERKPFTDETKAKMSEIALNRAKIVCPHCHKTGQISAMKRWHMDNCKHKTA
ncbi:hypothetical protein ABFK60_001240 [Escherichia coli O13/129/135:H4]